MKKPTKTEEDRKRDLREFGKKWLERIDAAGKEEKSWLDDASKAVAAYTGEGGTSDTPGTKYDFNILYANVETIVPAVINSQPVPDIRRRFADKDPAARVVSDILERAIRVQIDDSRLQNELEAMSQDGFLAGRGVIRVRFHSDIVEDLPSNDELEDAAEGEEGEDDGNVEADDSDGADGYSEDDADGEDTAVQAQGMLGHNGGPPLERLENERVSFEAVPWIDYRHGPAKRWSERPWDAFRFVIPREEEYESFDKDLVHEQLDDDGINKRNKCTEDLCGWEIWCKSKREVIFIDDEGVVLKRIEDPLGLSGFFCIATPIQPIEINGRLKPVNPFSIYRTIAEDLDAAVRRKTKLIDAMKAKGWYAGISDTDLNAIFNLEDNQFTPLNDVDLIMAAGGIDKAIYFWPLEKFIAAIQQVDAAIAVYKSWIYEITGISDIVRGASNASETATAQNIKSQWGSLRIQKMQRMIERAARDLFVMMAELIPSKFSPQSLEKITGIQLVPTQEDLTPVPPPMVDASQPEEAMAAKKQWEEAEQKRIAKLQQLEAVNKLLNEKLSMYYRIDVESDSTIRADLTRQKQEVAEFLQGASAYFAAVAPLVQQGALPAEAAVEIFAATARMFNLGKSVEDTLEQMVTQAKGAAQQAQKQPQRPPQPSPAEMAMAAKEEAETQRAQLDGKVKQQEATMKGQQFQFDMERQQAELQLKMADATRKAEADGRKAQIEAVIAEFDTEMKRIELQIKRTDLAIKETQLAQAAIEPVSSMEPIEEMA